MPKYMTISDPSNIKFIGNSRLWRNWLSYCRLLGDINFNCDFKCGSCKKSRKEQYQYKLTETEMAMNCCSGCRSNSGYLRSRELEILTQKAGSQIGKKLLKLWSEHLVATDPLKKSGFWRADTGCSLPLWARSPLCLSCSCEPHLYCVLKNLYSDPTKMIPVRKLRALTKKNNLLKK